MRFSDIQHQDRALSIVRRALRSGRTHHAYLFEGPAGVGKEMAAQALAARLLCTDDSRAPDADACGTCASCRVLVGGNHPDYHLIHRGLHKLHPDRSIRSSKGLFLVVDVVRRFLIEPASASPSVGRCRVFVVRDAERMNEDAQNALLKTLEEPPGRTRIILISSSASRLLATIRSRCQRVAFGWLPAEFVAQQLQEKYGVAPSAARTLAGLAGGSLGSAIHWNELRLLDTLQQVATLLGQDRTPGPEAMGKTLLEAATELATRTAAPPGDDADAAAADDDAEDDVAESKGRGKTVATDDLRAGAKLVLALVAAIQREALLIQAGVPDSLLNLSTGASDVAQRMAESSAPAALEEAIRAVATAETMLDRNVTPQLAFERLVIAISAAPAAV